MKNFSFKFAFTLFLIFMLACSNEEEIGMSAISTEINTIEITAKDFEYDNEFQTRTAIDITDEGIKFQWAENDTIGIFPDEGRQVSFPMTSGVGTNTAYFTGGGWALKSSSTYSAYYPLVGRFYLEKEDIPINYEGQLQIGNSSTEHLGDYDYMAAIASTPSNGSVNFKFGHLGSLVQIKIEGHSEATYSQLKLESEVGFPIKGSLNLLTQEITYAETSNTFILDLDGVSTTADNNTLLFYLLLAPTDYSEQEITATIVDDKNNSTITTLIGKNLQSGKAYGLTEKEKDNTILNITVGTPGSLPTILKDVPLTEIKELTLSGKLNNTDVITLRKMKNIKLLDIENVSFTTIDDENSYYSTYIDEYYEDTEISIRYDHTTETAYGNEMFSYLKSLEKVVWSKNIPFIPHSTFIYCENLKKIEFKNNITGIHYNAFSYTGFEVFEIPATVNQLSNAFKGCKSLKQLTVSPGNIKYTERNGVIYEDGLEKLLFAMPNLTGDVDIPWQVETLGYGAFSGTLIESVTFNDRLTYIPGDAFRGCSKLSRIYWMVNNKITRIGDFAFQGANLSSIRIPEGVTSLGLYAFRSNGLVEAIHFPTTIQYVNIGCFLGTPVKHIYMHGLPEDFISASTDDGYGIDGPFECYNYSIVHIRKETDPKKWYDKFHGLLNVAKEWVSDL